MLHCILHPIVKKYQQLQTFWFSIIHKPFSTSPLPCEPEIPFGGSSLARQRVSFSAKRNGGAFRYVLCSRGHANPNHPPLASARKTEQPPTIPFGHPTLSKKQPHLRKQPP